MKLFGVGTDIIRVNRIKQSLKNKLFLTRIFSDEEIIKCNRTKKNSNCFNQGGVVRLGATTCANECACNALANPRVAGR